MRQLPIFPERYWLKFSTEAISIKPFDSHSTDVAKTYIKKLNKLTHHLKINSIYHRGSTALAISGKGDVEIGIIPHEDYWFETIVDLANHFQGLGNLDEEYARFNDTFENYDIEVILMRGYTAYLDIKLNKFLLDNPNLLNEYEKIKFQYCYSEREYNQNKDAFFRRVIETIPD